MLVFTLLAKATEKIEKSKQEMLENLYARRGCSTQSFKERLELMRVLGEETQRRADEQQRRAEEAWKAKQDQRCAEEASRSGTGTNRNVWCASHRKA